MSDWKLSMLAEPIVPPFSSEHNCHTNGAELQRAEDKEKPWDQRD